MAIRLNRSDSHKFVFYAPPRCGARYLCQTLEQLGLVGGTSKPGFHPVVSHLCAPPPEGYSVVMAVRNPYTRMLSCWAWARQIKKLPDNLPFDDFVYHHARMWCKQLVTWLGENRRYVNHFIHLERFKDDILALPFCDREMYFAPNRYRSSYQEQGINWKQYYTPGTRRFVRQGWARDFELGGYDPEVWI